MLTISSVKVYPYKNKSPNGAIGVGQVVFDGGFLLSGLELIEHSNRRYIRYPKNKYNNHKLCYCQPINADAAKLVEDALFESYDKVRTSMTDESFIKTAVQDMVDTLSKEVKTAKALAAAGQVTGISEGPDPVDTALIIDDEEPTVR